MSNKDTTSNVVELLSNGQMTPLSTAKSLLEYIKDHPGDHVLAVVYDKDKGTISMGWSKMDAESMSMMLHYARWRWEQATFVEQD